LIFRWTTRGYLYFQNHITELTANEFANSKGNPIHLRSESTTDKALKVPDPNGVQQQLTARPPAVSARKGGGGWSPSITTVPIEIFRLNIADLTSLGCKGWRGILSNDRTVFVKLWDGWKFLTFYSEHEAFFYRHLRDLWDTAIPDFLGD
jgi:hypothetical protein